jgi:mannose-6-phosphate isomerase-like protein (cupin superfamily)
VDEDTPAEFAYAATKHEEVAMSEQARPVAIPPGEGPTIRGPAGGSLTFKVRGEQTDGRFTALENVIAPNDGPPLHTHSAEDESWYVIDGHLRFRLGDVIADAPSGTFVFVPRGTPHCFENIGAEPARILVMFNPSGMERFFDRFAEIPPGPPDPAAFRTIGSTAGMEVVGPPLRSQAGEAAV